MMQKTLLNKMRNQRYKELKQMSSQEFTDHVLSFSNQDLLNYNGDKLRPFPVGVIAHKMKTHNQTLSDKQQYTLAYYYTKITIADPKIIENGLNYSDLSAFVTNHVDEDTKGNLIYDVDYRLTPQPTTFNKHAVQVSMITADKCQPIGHLTEDFVTMQHIDKELDIHGQMTVSKDGANITYSLPLDLEIVDIINAEVCNNMNLDSIVDNLMNTSKKPMIDTTLTDRDLSNLEMCIQSNNSTIER